MFYYSAAAVRNILGMLTDFLYKLSEIYYLCYYCSYYYHYHIEHDISSQQLEQTKKNKIIIYIVLAKLSRQIQTFLALFLIKRWSETKKKSRDKLGLTSAKPSYAFSLFGI